jgi:hypothetical protein
MTVGIPAPLVSSGGGVPPVCARHGEPATQRKRVLFKSYTPRWAYLLILFGLLPFAIVAVALQKRVKAPAWPFCARCAKLRTGRLLAGIGVTVLAVLAVLVLAAVVPKDSSYGGPIVLMFVVLLVVGLAITANAARNAIASGYVSRDGSTVQIRRPHPRFAEEVTAALHVAAQQHYPQQYAPPRDPQHQQPYGSDGITPS